MYLKKETVSDGIPVWQNIEWVVQGGFTLDLTDISADQVLKAGTPMAYDEATRLARPLLQATVHADAGSTATQYQVEKGHNLSLGKHISNTIGGKSYDITAIDTSNASYDLITVSTSIGAATAGTVLFQSSGATGDTTGALNVSPKGLLYEDEVVAPGASVSIVASGTVYARRIPAYQPTIPSLMPLIIFSQSY